MDYARPEALVSTSWLADHLDRPDVRVLDGTYHLPTAGRDAAAEFAQQHIPGAARFDIDAVGDPDSPLPHMLPSPERFAAGVSALGIASTDRVVVYDVYGLQSAARTWWMFRVFGHESVAVLNGGLPKWLVEGRAVESGPARPRPPGRFAAEFRADLVRGLEQMRGNLASRAEQVLDARSAGRFTGAEPEPRAGMRSGHIPGSISLPFSDLLDPDDKTLLPASAIAARLAEAGVDPARPVAASCGSGVTACVLALGLYLLGHEDAAVYDGSWSEWGGRDDTPVETG